MALRWDARQIIGCVHCKTTVTWRNYSRHSQIIHNVIFSKDDVQWIDLNTNITKKGTLSLGERKSYVHEYEESQIATHQQSDKPEPHETTHDSTFPTEIPAPICPSSQQCTAISVRDKEGAPSPTASALDLLTCLPSLHHFPTLSGRAKEGPSLQTPALNMDINSTVSIPSKTRSNTCGDKRQTRDDKLSKTGPPPPKRRKLSRKEKRKAQTMKARATLDRNTITTQQNKIQYLQKQLAKVGKWSIMDAHGEFKPSNLLSLIQRKDSKVIDSWIKRIQYFIKIYYQFVGKYRNTGKGGRANFGFKIHLL
eukprot:1079657_1